MVLITIHSTILLVNDLIFFLSKWFWSINLVAFYSIVYTLKAMCPFPNTYITYLRSCVAKWWSVLVEQIHQLLGDDLGRHQQVLPPELLHGVAVGPGHVVRDGSRGELCLTNITKVSSEMNGLAWKSGKYFRKLWGEILCMNHETHWPQFYCVLGDIFN